MLHDCLASIILADRRQLFWPLCHQVNRSLIATFQRMSPSRLFPAASGGGAVSVLLIVDGEK
jgi:hypothetical protein